MRWLQRFKARGSMFCERGSQLPGIHYLPVGRGRSCRASSSNRTCCLRSFSTDTIPLLSSHMHAVDTPYDICFARPTCAFPTFALSVCLGICVLKCPCESQFWSRSLFSGVLSPYTKCPGGWYIVLYAVMKYKVNLFHG